MADLKVLAAQKRTVSGKGFSRRLRQDDIIPCVFYTGDGANISVQVAAPAMTKLFGEVGRTTVFNLEIDDNGSKSVHPVLIWDVQRHPVKNRITHVDFYGVDLDRPVKITVPIEFTGVARGTKVGGTLETYREQVQLVARPLDMPARIVLDITTLDVGKTIQVADLQLPEGVTAAYDVNYAIVSVLMAGGSSDAAEGGEEA